MAHGGKDFFISYTRADVAWAKWLDWHLRDAGYSTVVQVYDFRPGSSFVADMDRASREARTTLAVLSPDYLSALYTHSEWQEAFRRDPTGRPVDGSTLRSTHSDMLLGVATSPDTSAEAL